MKTSHIELLAPAGDFASLNAAINAGCHSVYFGIADFNMRASAAVNFTMENLEEVVQLCHQHKVKAYVTVNTLLYDEEMEKMKTIIDACQKAKVDAVICADMAAILYARSKKLRVHISTQLSISNIVSLKFYAQFADTIILARELTLPQIKYLCDQVQKEKITGPGGELVKIEIFAHGALCVAVSGRCAMSLYCNNTSASRGKCAQICRREFEVTDKQTGQKLKVDNNYVMSSADLCTIGMLDEIVKTGVSILKFEGRGRPPEYVDTVISTYKQALQLIELDQYNKTNIKKWNQKLKTVFNRGLSAGFYRGKAFYEWAGMSGSKATHLKLELGKVEKYYSKIKVVQIKISTKEILKINDQILIIGLTTGIVKHQIKELLIDRQKVKQAKQDEVVTFKLEQKVRENDQVYLFKERKAE